MTGLDAKFLYSETPTAHMHTVKVVVSDVGALGGASAYEDLVAAVGSRLDRLPPLRRRIVPVPLGLGHPVWVEDPAFDLRRHVHHRVLDGTADDRALAAVVAEVAAVPLPRDRPLWSFEVVEGLAGHRLAVIAKLHHAVADGSAAVALLRSFVDGVTAAPEPPAADPWRPEAIPTGRELLGRAVREHGTRWRGLPHLAAESVRRGRASEARRRTFEVQPPLPLHHVPRTSLNGSLTPGRTFAMTDLPLGPLRAVRRVAGTTLNDVYLAVCAGALRRYLADRGELPARPLVASVPVSTDPDRARLSGNRLDNLYVDLGTHLADPAARLDRLRAMTAAAKEVRDALGHDLFAQRADLVPPQLYHSALALWGRSHAADRVRPPLNVVLSNVAGPRERIRLGPVDLTALYSVGPILEGIGLNVTAWSYGDVLGVSFLGCPTTVPDPWVLVDALHRSMDELVAAVLPVGDRPRTTG